jgi:hypothetical protein
MNAAGASTSSAGSAVLAEAAAHSYLHAAILAAIRTSYLVRT